MKKNSKLIKFLVITISMVVLFSAALISIYIFNIKAENRELLETGQKDRIVTLKENLIITGKNICVQNTDKTWTMHTSFSVFKITKSTNIKITPDTIINIYNESNIDSIISDDGLWSN